MKKTILNLGKTLSKTEQKEITGGMFEDFVPCPGSSDYVVHNATTGSCSYPAAGTIFGGPFPGGRCLGVVYNGVCRTNF